MSGAANAMPYDPVGDLSWLLAAALRAEFRRLGLPGVIALGGIQVMLGLAARQEWEPSEVESALRGAASAANRDDDLVTDLAWFGAAVLALDTAQLSGSALNAVNALRSGLGLTGTQKASEAGSAIRAALAAGRKS